MPAATTKKMPKTGMRPGACPSTTKPASSATAGSMLISVPKAPVVIRRRERNSRQNGSARLSAASPNMVNASGQVRRPDSEGPAIASETAPATGMETASPFRPLTRSPTCWVSRM